MRGNLQRRDGSSQTPPSLRDARSATTRRAFVYGGETPIVDGDADDARAERLVMRLASGGPMAACVGSGYVIGRDDETRAEATAAFLGFFGHTLIGS